MASEEVRVDDRGVFVAGKPVSAEELKRIKARLREEARDRRWPP